MFYQVHYRSLFSLSRMTLLLTLYFQQIVNIRLPGDFWHPLFLLPAGCHGNLPVLNLLSASSMSSSGWQTGWQKISIFAPGGKTMRWIENDWHLLELSGRSQSACKVWGDRTKRAGCKSEKTVHPSAFVHAEWSKARHRGHSGLTQRTSAVYAIWWWWWWLCLYDFVERKYFSAWSVV